MKETETEKKESLELSSEMENLMSFIEEDLSKELPVLTIDLNYFILGVLVQKKSDLYHRLDSCMMSSAMEAIYNSFYQVVASKALSAVKSNRKLSIDKQFADILLKAEDEARNMGADEVTSEHVFLAILADNSENNKIRRVFNRGGITYGIMASKVADGSPTEMTKQSITLPDGRKGEVRLIHADSPEEATKIIEGMMRERGDDDIIDLSSAPLPGMPRKKKGKNANIKEYCTNLNELVQKGKIEALVGREHEVDEIIRILGRKKKNNAILVGGEGVGKTAIGESLAYKIVHGDVPEFLLNKVLVSLDMTALMAGTTLRGMFEERVKGIIDEVKADPNFILFMDNIGAIFADKGKNDYEISSMLSTALENGEVQVIGTSDFKSYRKTFDKDPSLARRFQKIIVEAPSVDDSIEILKGLRPSYEDYHKVKYSDDSIVACVKLAHRYMTERNLPDSAIDILDEVGAYVGTISEPVSLREQRNSISALESEIENLKKEKNFEEADSKSKELVSMKKAYTEAKNEYENNRKESPAVIDVDDILNIVSVKTNIPVNNLTSDDKEKLVHMNDRIKAEVIGQNEAIDTICKALKRNRIGLHKNGCMYSAMMIGKTGTGKCVGKNTVVKIRNKKTGEIQSLTVSEFEKMLNF